MFKSWALLLLNSWLSSANCIDFHYTVEKVVWMFANPVVKIIFMVYTRHKTHANFDFWNFKSFFSFFKRGTNAFLHSSHVVRGSQREISDHWLPRSFKPAELLSLFQTFHAGDRQAAQSALFWLGNLACPGVVWSHVSFPFMLTYLTWILFNFVEI